MNTQNTATLLVSKDKILTSPLIKELNVTTI